MATATKNAPAAAKPAEQQADPTLPTGFDPKRWMSEQLDKPVSYKPFMAENTLTLTARTAIKWLCRPTKSGRVCSEDHAIRFLKLCEARQLNPWEGDAYIIGFDGKDGPEFQLITAHQAFLKRAEAHPQYDGMESGVLLIDDECGELVEMEGDYVPKGYAIDGGWCKVFRKDRSRPTYKRLKLSTFNKGQSRWNIDAPGMIVKCAEADALRTAFPNNLAGMYLQGEMPEEDPATTAAKTPRERVAEIKAPKVDPTTNGHAPTPEPEPAPIDDGINEPPNLPPSETLFAGSEQVDAIKG